MARSAYGTLCNVYCIPNFLYSSSTHLALNCHGQARATQNVIRVRQILALIFRFKTFLIDTAHVKGPGKQYS